MSSYTLRYFPFRARAETIRLLLLASGENFSEETPDWPADRDQQPLGQLPVLIEKDADGSEFVLTESQAIEKYFAEKLGLLVKTGLKDTARETQLRAQLNDVINLLFGYIYGSENAREETLEQFKGQAELLVKYHEKILADNGSNGHYFGDKTTYVDVCLYTFLTVIRQPSDAGIPNCADFFTERNAPEMNKVFQAVQNDPIAAAYKAKYE
ncbi:hypothetical protein LPJ78_000878 [Coemansia sp. RSA 989]|nr:hypothetical protein BX667DRAFT_493779 [Coemansia mojavensis]KAJ1743501.1 hypothetical protein LPJ68_000879 [Coemansia sp. RSA 1086]KAJ1753788.1 hypothetical protein LPJ79_000075 [Coemansia sp. RSA 1821]KAJ1867643.1 hypothetical protein LPJ78_000878 [Coemansia sp. RSA 989]KAJ1875906.1 hypothetical protein LPJ55_000320 [Coemansia sp. RSA 990]KAJ2630874.1 hypothetical protein H4R22_002371 [Coemansia sp. RSA 1290]KAJ2653789.1 hypothetical protein IWW40_000073 [Coemansia sp. RSA 1250]KAJ26769